MSWNKKKRKDMKKTGMRETKSTAYCMEMIANEW